MKRLIYVITILLLSLAILNSSAADLSPAPQPEILTDTSVTEEEGRLWNLQDADILSVINEVSLETGKNFVVDPRVSGKVSLISSKPIKSSEVYQVFLSVLEILGYSAIPSNGVVKIVPNMESGEFSTKVATRERSFAELIKMQHSNI